MHPIIQGALTANAAGLGFHWIYDSAYIKAVAKHQPLIFRPQQRHHYTTAKEAYFGYPDLPVGTVTMQGHVMKWLYEKLKHTPDFSRQDYKTLIFDTMQPGGVYQGYVESYANKMIASMISERFKLGMPPLKRNDDHLIGMVPYLVCHALDLPLNKAWDLAQLFTHNKDYLAFYEMLEKYFEALKTQSLQSAIKTAIQSSPDKERPIFEDAITMDDTDAFVQKYDLVACSVHKAMPVAFHIAYHASSFETAIKNNMLIGGNLSDRGGIIGAMLAPVFGLPENWVKQTLLE